MLRDPADLRLNCLKVCVTALLLGVLMPSAAEAQGSGCTARVASFPNRHVLHCRDGLKVEAEAGTDYTLLDRDRDGGPDAATLRSGALLVDQPARSGRRGFQILTPQAIAAVRGTQWIADVAGDRTSVFVVSGRVQVQRTNAPRGVVLGPGQGVDVDPGSGPLAVRRWPAPRVAALLARFGR